MCARCTLALAGSARECCQAEPRSILGKTFLAYEIFPTLLAKNFLEKPPQERIIKAENETEVQGCQTN
jgi:hypothetical protein